ncbi:MAG: pyridoxamine 5'-phosphate oxidase family protein, partial [Ruminococcus sp.]|nr:pyridoxamine 5'-phosphate oxidase family protein [Ruminococcus sp.]
MSKVSDFLNEAGVFFMATADGNQPKLRPLGAHMEADGKIIFGVGDFKNVYRQMKANPLVEIVCSLVLGAIMGWILTQLEKLFNSNTNRLNLTIAFVFITVALSMMEFHIGPV